MNVDNGQRVPVSMLGYHGLAGLVERADADDLSFAARHRALPVKAGDVVTVADQARTVLSIGESPFLRGFVVIRLAKMGA